MSRKLFRRKSRKDSEADRSILSSCFGTTRTRFRFGIVSSVVGGLGGACSAGFEEAREEEFFTSRSHVQEGNKEELLQHVVVEVFVSSCDAEEANASLRKDVRLERGRCVDSKPFYDVET